MDEKMKSNLTKYGIIVFFIVIIILATIQRFGTKQQNIQDDTTVTTPSETFTPKIETIPAVTESEITKVKGILKNNAQSYDLCSLDNLTIQHPASDTVAIYVEITNPSVVIHMEDGIECLKLNLKQIFVNNGEALFAYYNDKSSIEINACGKITSQDKFGNRETKTETLIKISLDKETASKMNWINLKESLPSSDLFGWWVNPILNNFNQ